MTPADEIRQAVAHIRAIAAAAPAGPWSMRDAWKPTFGTAVRVKRIANDEHETVIENPGGGDIEGLPAAFDHIALWHPGMASLVADVLELAAVRLGQVAVIATVSEGFRNGPWPVESAALNLARAINASKES